MISIKLVAMDLQIFKEILLILLQILIIFILTIQKSRKNPGEEAVSRPPDNTLLEEPESHAKELFIGIILCLLIFSGVVLINGADYTPSGVSPAPENRITSNGDDTTSQVNTTVSDQPLPVADFSAGR